MAHQPTEAAVISSVHRSLSPRRAARPFAAACAALAALVLSGAWLWLALDHGTPWLWNVVVHESGRYTLRDTMLYFGHFLREVPITCAYVLFLLGVSGGDADHRHPSRAAGIAALTLAALLIVLSIALAARTAGLSSALLDLAQYRTRDDLSGYGTHWRYHWLSTLWFGALLSVMPLATVRVRRLPLLRASPGWRRAAWLYFLVATLVFGLSTDVFTDPRYAGHQAREIMTHALVTLPLGVALVLAWRRPTNGTAAPGAVAWLQSALIIGIPLYLAVLSLSGDVMTHGQSSHGLGAMVAAHYFEHTLDYLLVLLLLTGGMAHSSRRPKPEPGDVASRTAA